MSEKLLPCPFCGDKGEITEVDSYSMCRRYNVFCKECGGNKYNDACSEAEAAQTWNTRPLARAERNKVLDEVLREFEAKAKACCDIWEKQGLITEAQHARGVTLYLEEIINRLKNEN